MVVNTLFLVIFTRIHRWSRGLQKPVSSSGMLGSTRADLEII
jgi:hypothetical protein